MEASEICIFVCVYNQMEQEERKEKLGSNTLFILMIKIDFPCELSLLVRWEFPFELIALQLYISLAWAPRSSLCTYQYMRTH